MRHLCKIPKTDVNCEGSLCAKYPTYTSPK